MIHFFYIKWIKISSDDKQIESGNNRVLQGFLV